jgi:hypothetical protein
MAVTPLGLLGSAVQDDPGGSSDTLDIMLTTGIAASDVATSRLVLIRYVSVGPAPGDYPLPASISDTAVLTAPNVCYGPNEYASPGFTVAGDIPLVEGVLLSFVWQPLEIGTFISIVFDQVFDYARAAVFGYDDAESDPAPRQPWSDYFPLPAPAAGCQSVPATLPAATQYVSLGAVEWLEATVSTITFVDGGTTVLYDFYDWAGTNHVSGAFADAPAAPGAFDIGACTDVFPTPSTDFQGDVLIIDEGAGLEPCPTAYGVQASVGDYVT